jgi:hypothetical protein
LIICARAQSARWLVPRAPCIGITSGARMRQGKVMCRLTALLTLGAWWAIYNVHTHSPREREREGGREGEGGGGLEREREREIATCRLTASLALGAWWATPSIDNNVQLIIIS